MATDKVTPVPERDVLEVRLQSLRDRVFRAQGICGLGALTAQHISETRNRGDHGQLATDVWTALEAARAMLDEIAGELEADTLLRPIEEEQP